MPSSRTQKTGLNTAGIPSGMRILLINPPNSGRSIPEEEYGIDSIKMILRGEPLALETLAGALPEHEIRILDLKAEPVSVMEEVKSFRPDIVGITGMTCEANSMLQIARDVRSSGQAKIVVGGIHASNDPDFFNREEIDFIVIGIGKLSFRELVNALSQDCKQPDIAGIAQTAPGKELSFAPRQYCKADLLNEFSPRYDLVESHRAKYFLKDPRMVLGMVVSAYGCPYRCNFCCIEPLTAGRYLTCDIDSVVRDINLLSDLNFIRLVDANSFADPAQSMTLCKAITDNNINKNFIADVRSDTVVKHPEMLHEWKKAGLRSVVVGFEEIDNQTLREMNKSNDVAHNTEAIRILRELGISIIGDFIISPDFDHTDFDNLERYLDDNPIDLAMPTIMTPLPGTGLYQKMASRITNHNLDYYTLTNAVMPTKIPEKDFYQRYATIILNAHRGAQV